MPTYQYQYKYLPLRRGGEDSSNNVGRKKDIPVVNKIPVGEKKETHSGGLQKIGHYSRTVPTGGPVLVQIAASPDASLGGGEENAAKAGEE